LEPTGHVQAGEKPSITQYYAETFNKVDMFNRLHSEIQYKFRCGTAKLCWLINSLLIAVINSWVIWLDFHHEDSIEKDEERLKIFVNQLAEEIISSNEQ